MVCKKKICMLQMQLQNIRRYEIINNKPFFLHFFFCVSIITIYSFGYTDKALKVVTSFVLHHSKSTMTSGGANGSKAFHNFLKNKAKCINF
jgi:hypothetical protein